MKAEGWYVDPFGVHRERWFSDGRPTSLVRDGDAESHDPPPEATFDGTPEELPEEEEDAGADLLRADEEPPESSSAAAFDAFGGAIGGFD